MDVTTAAIPPSSGSRTADGRCRCILVLGMHRSGTSVVTKIISLLGADLPQSLMRPRADNPRGYWESGELMDLHDRLLASSGSSWDDWDPFPRPHQPIDETNAIKEQLTRLLHREFGSSKLFVVKDPRVCRFVPVWLELLRQMQTQAHAVLPLRHPFEVADSLPVRNEIPFGLGCLIWLRHVIEAERATRHIPRVWVNYEDLLSHWRPEVERLVRDLDLPWPRGVDETAADINEFLSARLRHHAGTLDDLDARSDMVDWVPRTYHALRSLKSGGRNEADYAELDAVRREFDRACLAFSDGLRAERLKWQPSTKGEVDRRRGPLEELQDRLPYVLSLPLRAMSALLAGGRRLERGFRKWRRGASGREPSC